MNFKRLSALFLAVLLVCGLALSACGEGEDTPDKATEATLSAEAEYKVKVCDPLGNPCVGAIVRFMNGTEQAAMAKTGEDGVAAKTLARGDYTVELDFTDGADSYFYDTSALKLTKEVTEVSVELYRSANNEFDLYISDVSHTAYSVGVGCTYVELTPGDINYFVFTPTEGGTYEFSVIGDAALGYYGAPHFVQPNSLIEMVDNKFSESIRDSMINASGTGTTQMVLGLTAGDGVENAALCIERIGEPAWSVEDEPWDVYETTVELAPYVLPEDAELKVFDVTASTDTYNLVFNEADGFYHMDTADGPLVYVRLGEANKYTDSFMTMIDTANMCRYFYEEDGTFIRKETYNACLNEYIDCMDEEYGVYPLTKDLEYIIKQTGEYSGWWDPNVNGIFIFDDINGNPIVDLNADIAWLFMCCYAVA